MRVVVGIVGLLAVVGFSTASRVAGRIVILEKDNKPSPDLSNAVLYLETPASVTTAARPITLEIAITDKSYTFEHPGLVRVYCNVHPRMVAYVLVMENRYYAQPANDGSFAIDNVPAGRYRLHVWHERIPSEVVKDVSVGSGQPDLQIALSARGYKWEPHRNKYGRNYPTNAGRERY